MHLKRAQLLRRQTKLGHSKCKREFPRIFSSRTRQFVRDTKQRFSLYREYKFYCFSEGNIRNQHAGKRACPLSRDAHRNKRTFTCAGFCDNNWVFVTTINVLFRLPGMLKVKRQWKNNLEREIVATEKSLPINLDQSVKSYVI